MAEAAPIDAVRTQLLVLEHDTLELIATGAELAVALDGLCRFVEQLVPGIVASILAVRDGKLYPLASPSLPTDYVAAISGTAIGPAVGSCGTAAWRGEAVEVHNVRRDPLWLAYQWLPLPGRLVACWSSPIRSRDRKVIGTFAFYYPEERGPDPVERMIVDTCIHVCSIAIEHDRARHDLERLAFEDTVTRLMNRTAFTERADRAVEAAALGSPSVAFLVLDVDDFKQVNDALGHPLGDRLLAVIGDRLRTVAGADDIIARMGGDEFAILQANATRETAADLAWNVLAEFASPFLIEDHQVAVNASIGIALACEDGESLEYVLKSADLALYRAKAEGRGRHCFFTPALAEAARNRHLLAVAIKRALDDDAFSLVYQPIVSLPTRAIVGCEALIRWRHPTRGEVLPSVFIPVAEGLGLIGRLGRWVLGEASRQAVAWPSETQLSVNISPLQLRQAGFAEETLGLVAGAGLDPGRVILEITESAALDDSAAVRETLFALKRHGFAIALDDFGTGYASLRSLRAAPIDKIKIDQSFIADFADGGPSTSIVRAVIAMARSLGLTTTAEGVETAERAEQLAHEGCHEAQGFHFSRPLPAEAIATLLRLGHARGLETVRAASGA